MLISHRQSAYLDNEELERAAGLMEIQAQADTEHGELYAAGAAVLRILQNNNLKEGRDLVLIFERIVAVSFE